MTWKILSIAMLCCCSLPAWAADAWCSSRETPALTFAWQPKNQADPTLGSVQVKDASGTIVQVIENLENYHGDSELLRTSTDLNNDGCADLVVTYDLAAIGNESAKAFLYNPNTRQFDFSKALSDIGGLDLDPLDKRCVTGTWKGGEADMVSTRHCWSKGKLLIDSEHDVSARYNREGEFQCYLHVETHYRGGKKRKRTSCTQTF